MTIYHTFHVVRIDGSCAVSVLQGLRCETPLHIAENCFLCSHNYTSFEHPLFVSHDIPLKAFRYGIGISTSRMIDRIGPTNAQHI